MQKLILLILLLLNGCEHDEDIIFYHHHPTVQDSIHYHPGIRVQYSTYID